MRVKMVMSSRALPTEKKLNRRQVLLALLIKMIWARFSNFVLHLNHLGTVLCGGSKSTDLKELGSVTHRAQQYVVKYVRCPREKRGLQCTFLSESLRPTFPLQMSPISVTFFSLK